jgi:hypothetical protein
LLFHFLDDLLARLRSQRHQGFCLREQLRRPKIESVSYAQEARQRWCRLSELNPAEVVLTQAGKTSAGFLLQSAAASCVANDMREGTLKCS